MQYLHQKTANGDYDNDDDDRGLEQKLISHDKVMDEYLKWLEQQDEANAYNTNVLYKLQEMADKKGLVNYTNKHKGHSISTQHTTKPIAFIFLRM